MRSFFKKISKGGGKQHGVHTIWVVFVCLRVRRAERVAGAQARYHFVSKAVSQRYMGFESIFSGSSGSSGSSGPSGTSGTSETSEQQFFDFWSSFKSGQSSLGVPSFVPNALWSAVANAIANTIGAQNVFVVGFLLGLCLGCAGSSLLRSYFVLLQIFVFLGLFCCVWLI